MASATTMSGSAKAQYGTCLMATTATFETIYAEEVLDVSLSISESSSSSVAR